MKKQIIACAIGALILFIWQFLSWGILPVHKAEYGYSANQDQIMAYLSQNLSESGTYMLPGSPPGTSHDEMEKDMQKNIGKPWAVIHYHSVLDMNMGMNMFRGIVVDLLAIFLLVWLFGKFASLTMKDAVSASVAVGFIAYLVIPYVNSIWFETSSIGYLIDAIVPWAAIGVWLGWYIPKN